MTASRVLFDAPGPRGRRRIAITTVLSAVLLVLLVLLALQRFSAHGELTAAKWRPFTQYAYLHYLLVGLLHTIEAAALAIAVSIPIGLVLALVRLAPLRPLRIAAGAYIELFRSVPLLLLIFFFLLALPRFGVSLPPFWLLVLPLIISNAATLAEIFRSGILSLERGQSEAAFSIGLTYAQTMRLVVLPQALRRLAPAVVSQLVATLKGTSLGYVVSYDELLQSGRILGEFTQTLIQTYLVVALFYIVINIALSRLARGLEVRQRRRGPVLTLHPPASAEDVAVGVEGADAIARGR